MGDCQVCCWWDLVYEIRVMKEFEMFWRFVLSSDDAVVKRMPRECISDRSKKIYGVRNCGKKALLRHTE